MRFLCVFGFHAWTTIRAMSPHGEYMATLCQRCRRPRDAWVNEV